MTFTQEQMETITSVIQDAIAVSQLRRCGTIPGLFVDSIYKYDTVCRGAFVGELVDFCRIEKLIPQTARTLTIDTARDFKRCLQMAPHFTWAGKEWRLEYCTTPQRLQLLLERYEERAGLLRDIIRMEEQAGRTAPNFAALAKIQRAWLLRRHEELVLETNTRNLPHYLARIQKKCGTCTFPPPPLPGKGEITPIETAEQLLIEGAHMQNCVSSYAEMIIKGSCYIYRVLKPRRLTVELRCKYDQWTIGQVKARCNGESTTQEKELIRAWLRGFLKYEAIQCRLDI